MTVRLIIISGPASTGKMPLARELRRIDPALTLVHRDDIRRILSGPVSEGLITLIMGDTTRRLLQAGCSVIVCAWNLEKIDHDLWFEIARETAVPLVWLDVRASEVAAMIPPMEN